MKTKGRKNRLGAGHRGTAEALLVKTKSIIVIVAFGLALIVLLPKIGSFHSSFEYLRGAQRWLVLLSVVLSASTFVFAALSYRSLSYVRVRYSGLLLIQLANSFVSKLAPAGTGGLALNARFLTKNGHTIAQAASVAVTNNIVGIGAHLSLLFLVFAHDNNSIRVLPLDGLSILPSAMVLTGIGAVILLAAAYFSKGLQKKALRFMQQLREQLSAHKQRPKNIIVSYISLVCLTLLFVGTLYACSYSLGVIISPLQALAVLTVGVAVGAATPTPGGIGGAEAGLVAGLAAFGIEASAAISVTLLYRLVTYWLPIVPGFIAFQYAVNKELV